MLEWATKEKVNSEFYKNTMAELRRRYVKIVGDDNLTIYKEFELPYIIEKIKEQNGTKILDFGTGTSCLPAYLNSYSFDITCLDSPPDKGGWHPEVTEQTYNEVYKSKVKYIKTDILTDFDWCPDNFFDVIYSASTLEHIKYPEKYIRILKKKLKKGGLHIHIIDYDLVHHPIDFNKIIRAMGLKDVLDEEPEDFYNPIPNIGRIAIYAN